MADQLQQKVKACWGHAKPKSEKTATPKPVTPTTPSSSPQLQAPTTPNKSHLENNNEDGMCAQQRNHATAPQNKLPATHASKIYRLGKSLVIQKSLAISHWRYASR
jgi:hypothetical protein